MCLAVISSGCIDQSNPLLEAYDTPFQTPPFHKIRIEHFKPAFEQAIAEHRAEIDAIANNQEDATFENTIVALENAGKTLGRVRYVFSCLTANVKDDALAALSREMTPILTAHSSEMALNEKIFSRIKTLYDNRNLLNLDKLQLRTLEKTYDDYVRRGAALDAESKEKMKQLNSELAMATLAFSENVLKETKNFKIVIENQEELKGVPESVVKAAAETAAKNGLEGKWVLTVDKPCLLPVLTYSENRALREQIYRGYYYRADLNNEFDNKKVINDIVRLRNAQAKLLGYGNYAQMTISKNMAATPENVYELLLEMWRPGLEAAKSDLKEMQKIADADKVKIEAWDWWYYAEKLRKERFNLDEEALKPYFKLENVRDGMFWVATQLYGVTFKQRTDIPVYDDDVQTFEVIDKDGSHLAVLYLDFFPRNGKGAGAWCSRLRSYSFNDGKEILPLVTISCNFTPPVGNNPALLSWDETETMFHEFGHAIHGFFTRGRYQRVAGNLARDMIELPSQIMENWAAEPAVLKQYARHWQTNEPMPEELIAKLRTAYTFNQGWATTEHMAAALLDMDWYTLDYKESVDVDKFEKEVLKKYGLIDEIMPRYRSTFFAHVFSGGYSAGYYVYTWAAVLDIDAFQMFKQSGDLFNKEYAELFRKHILTEGGYDEGMVQYEKFRGQEPSVEPLLRKRGFIQ